MTEIYKNSSEYIDMTIYVAGVPTNADGPVTVTLTDLGSDTALLTGTATVDTSGKYQFLLPVTVTEEDRALRVVWSYTTNSNVTTRHDTINIVTPYITVDEVWEAHPTLRNNSYDEIKEMESRVRAVINAVTGQSFGSHTASETVYGTNKDLLRLSHRAYLIESISVNGQVIDLPIDAITFDASGYGFRIFPYGPYYNIKPDTFSFGRYFARNVKYTVTGKFGWEYVPLDVKTAAKMLIGDYFCSDSQWRQRGITRVRAADWAFDFGTHSFSGTGNVDVDKILDQYREINMVII